MVLPVVATALLVQSGAFADDSSPRVLEQRLTALESKPDVRALIAEPAAAIRRVLERIKLAHAAGDVPFALELGVLAKDHLELAADIVRATELEAELSKLQKELNDVEQKRRQTETLLEETIAQRERSKQELLRVRAEKAQRLKTEADKASPKPLAGKSASKVKP